MGFNQLLRQTAWQKLFGRICAPSLHRFAMTAAMEHPSYDVLGDPAEYESWLKSQKPPEPEPAFEVDQRDLGQQVADVESLPAEIAQVVRHMEQQHVPAVLAAFQDLQVSRYQQVCCISCVLHLVKTLTPCLYVYLQAFCAPCDVSTKKNSFS